MARYAVTASESGIIEFRLIMLFPTFFSDCPLKNCIFIPQRDIIDATMRDIWFADNRDLVKWSVLLHLAEQNKAKRIIQIAYHRPSEFGQVSIDGKEAEIPKAVASFFRDLKSIKKWEAMVKVDVFDRPFEKDRDAYHRDAIKYIQKFNDERCIIFLDPDTGLEPSRKPKLEHVLNKEAKAVFDGMKSKDVFVFYQHQTNRNGSPWIEEKRKQLAGALEVLHREVKIALGRKIAHDVVFYYVAVN